MDLSELHRVQRQERSTDSLQELRESFYSDVAVYIESLREERAEAAAEADDPFRSATVNKLNNEIETAEHVAEAIYEKRLGKLVREASLKATGNGGDKSGLTAEEQDLFEDIVDRIADNKSTVLDQFRGRRPPEDRSGDSRDDTESSETVSGETQPSNSTPLETDDEGGEDQESAESGQTDSITESTASPAEAMGDQLDSPPDESAPPNRDAETASADDSAVDRITVRMTRDVGEIFGVDAETYDLGEDEIVDLPSENADPLLERDAAERVEE